jgi:hypothetical protein
MKLMSGWKALEKIGCLKKMALKMDFRCESYALFKKGINGNQSATWQVEVGPHGDGCTMRWLSKKNHFFSNFSYKLTFTNKLLMK